MDNHHNFITELIDTLDTWFEKASGVEPARMSANLYPYHALFSPFYINDLKIKNRIVMAPIGNVYMAEESGRPSPKMIAYLSERAEGGVGLITSGLTPTGQGIDPTLTEPGEQSLFPRIDRSRFTYSGWRTLVENIHSSGARFFVQLSPGLGRVGSPLTVLTKLQLPVSASWNPNFYLPAVPCRPLLDLECRAIIRRTAQAAADAKELGMDGVYLHGHEGYLLDQMTNPSFNRRLIGHYADKQRFGVELVKAIRKKVGAEYPIMYRIGLSPALHAVYGRRMQTVNSLRKFRNERQVAETLEYMVNLVRAGVDAFDVDLGVYDNWWLPHPPSSMPPGCYLAVSRLVKEYFASIQLKSNRGIEVPVAGVGKLGYPDLAEAALRRGDCDMIMLGRPLLADASWATKAYAGKVASIRPCIGDQEACLKGFVKGTHVQCAVNPRTGFEDILAKTPPPAEHIKKIGVVGAGPAGIIFSITAARRGHQVHLYEKRNRIGGMMLPGCIPTIKYEVGNYLCYLETAIEQTKKDYALKLQLGVEAGLENLAKEKFDALVIATGGKLTAPSIPGINGAKIVQAIDLFEQPKLAENAQNILVIGGGSVGCEIAHWLATEMGKNVNVVEKLPYIMPDVMTANRTHLIHLLEKSGVSLLNCAFVKRVEAGKVIIERNVSPTVPNPYNTWNPILPANIDNPLAKPIREKWQEQILPADLIVLATGLAPNTMLYESCVQAHIAAEIHLIGDCFEIGRIFEAVKAGYLLGINI